MEELTKAMEILGKLSFFGGQRAGRELWNDKPREVQDEDIADFNRDIEYLKDIICKHMNDDWISVEERLPGKREWRGYDINTNVSYMRRLEIAYMTDIIEYTHGYYDGYKWMDKWQDTIKNVVAWKIHEPYHPESKTEKPDWRQDMLRKFDRRE